MIKFICVHCKASVDIHIGQRSARTHAINMMLRSHGWKRIGFKPVCGNH